MALKQLDDSAQDERFNPSGQARDLYRQEGDAAFNNIADNYDKTADDTAENKNIAQLKKREENQPWTTNITPSAKKQKITFKGLLKKKRSIGLLAAILLGGGAGFSLLLAPGIGIVHLKETFMNNLDDQTLALDKRSIYVMSAKVQGNASFCSNVVNIRCKFSSLSDRRINKLNANGFAIEKADSKVPGRSQVKTMTFTDKSGKVHTIKNPGEMRNLLASSGDARSSFRTAFNSRFENFSGKAFNSLMRKIPGINKTQKIPDTADKAKINKAIQSAAQGRPISAQNGTGAAEGEEGGQPADEEKSNGRTSEVDEEAKKVSESGKKAATSMFKGAARGVGIIGGVDALCVVKNTMNAVEVGAKVMRAGQLANFAMIFLTMADAMKAGDVTPGQVETVGNILTATDNRETIEYTDDKGNVSKQPNPYYKKSAFDSVGYRMAAYGDKPQHDVNTIQYLVGGTPALGALSGINDAISVSDQTCKIVQNPFVRAASGIVGIIVGIGSFGATLALSVGGSLAISAALPYLQSLLIDMVAGVAVDEDTVGPAAGDAITSGTTVILGTMAQANGMQPSNGSQAAQSYAYANTAATQEDIDYQTVLAQVEPLNAYNPYSLVGMITGSLYPKAVSASASGSSALATIASLPTHALQSLIPTNTASAATGDSGCSDPSYEGVGLKPGGMCQLNYYMTSAELAMDPMENVEWMLSSGNLDDEGMPKGKYADFMKNCVERMDAGVMVPFGTEGESTTNGSECIDSSSNVMADISHFRVYTMDSNISMSIDYETEQEVAAEEVEQSEVIVSTGEWASPAPAYTKTLRGFGYPVGYNSDVSIGGGRWGHNGVDLSGTRQPEDMFAACDGVISSTRFPTMNQVERTNANTIVINCGGGISAGYHHAALSSSLQNGAAVKAGQKIGRSDLSGNTTGYHVHLTIRVNGNFVNPVPFFKDKGFTLLK